MRLIILLAFACTCIAAAPQDPKAYPSVMGMELVIDIVEKGKKVGTLDAAFADGQITSAWLKKAGFASPAKLSEPSFDGSSNKRTTYNLDLTNAKGDRMTMTFTVYDAKNGGALSGQLSHIKSGGGVSNFALSANKVIRK